MLKDEDDEVREYVAYVLIRLQSKEAIPGLIALLKDEDSDIRKHVAKALVKLQSKEAIPGLIALLKDEYPYVRESAVYALGELQAKEAIPELIALLKDENDAVIYTLEQYDLGILAEGLFLGISHNDEFVRKKSISVIGYYSQ